jgi:hypothetical protein
MISRTRIVMAWLTASAALAAASAFHSIALFYSLFLVSLAIRRLPEPRFPQPKFSRSITVFIYVFVIAILLSGLLFRPFLDSAPGQILGMVLSVAAFTFLSVSDFRLYRATHQTEFNRNA